MLRNEQFESLISVICYSVIFTSIYIFVEYISKNIIHFDIENYVQHLSRLEYVSTVLEDKNRPRGFATESGIMSIFYEMFIFVLFFCSSRLDLSIRLKLLVRVAICSSFFGIVLLFSSAAISILILGMLIVVFYEGIGFKKFVALFFMLAAFVTFFRDEIYIFFINTFMNKIAFLFSGELIGSAAERASVYNTAISTILKYPFGIGFGIAPQIASDGDLYYGEKVNAGQVSLFLTIMLSGGLFALFSLFLWLLLKIKKIMNSGSSKGYLLASLGAIIIHYSLVSEFWIPFFWFTVAITGELASFKKRATQIN